MIIFVFRVDHGSMRQMGHDPLIHRVTHNPSSDPLNHDYDPFELSMYSPINNLRITHRKY